MSAAHRTLVIRADASTTIGTGHVMRCLALAQAWQEAGGQVTFAIARDVPAVQQRLASEGMRVVRFETEIGSADDAAHTIQLARESNARWVVLDGYQFTAEMQRAIKQAGFSLLWIDDNGDATHYYADIVLNQNLHADARLYATREPYTDLLLGTRYVLLRREFRKWREWRRGIPAVACKVLVTLGGGDANNVTLQVIEALQQVVVEGLEIVVVVGASNPHVAELAAAARVSRVPIRLETHAPNMPELMAWADVAIAGAGSTCWELAFMGLPSIVLTLADNQKPIGEYLDAQRVAIHLGAGQGVHVYDLCQSLAGLLMNFERRFTMSQNARALVDGGGAARVVSHMNKALRLRPVRADDCHLLWEWANDLETRAFSFSTEPIPWEHHVEWFITKLHDPQCMFFVAMEGEQPVAQIRFDIHGDQANVSVSVARQARGRGVASRVLALGSRQLLATTAVRVIHAYVKPNNSTSLRAFAKAGFENMGETKFGEHVAIHLVLKHEHN